MKELVLPGKDMNFKWDIPLLAEEIHKTIGIAFLAIKNRKDSLIQIYPFPLS
jgi:hypothetical protein